MLYAILAYGFLFAPIAASFVFSLNADRFPTLPLSGFSFAWYEAILSDRAVWDALLNSLRVAFLTAILSTTFGFGAAYTDYRYNFFGKGAYLALALLPPTVPVLVLGLAMLAFLSRISLSGELYSVVIAHSVLATPFAMAIIRLRLSQIDPAIEGAAWNLGASPWRAMRYVILPFARPAIISALFLTMAVSFDEYAMAWFVSGLNETVPVRVLSILQGSVSPEINAIGSIVFTISIALVVLAQVIYTRNQNSQNRRMSH
ncbi:MAG: ABC transporter permease [Phyllobacteriaceae bacterium]|jgi:spermidine/putrescine transport system permease protein|nr:ABC transporter permease [Phyllobacteriaceae bacterium]